MKRSGIRRQLERRVFLRGMAGVSGLAVAGCATVAAGRVGHPPNSTEAEVTPGEDLMQEHGALERILLIYEEAAHRLEAGQPLDLTLVVSAARIVRNFVEDYHEKLEERFVFPRLEAAHLQGDVVATLLEQHQRGRALTDEIVRRSALGPSADLAPKLRAFVRMYRPHAAREETVILPLFRELVGRSGYRELGERFEDEECMRFGEGGFERVVSEISRLEDALSIGNLAHFTASI